jgi:hypothetical protein
MAWRTRWDHFSRVIAGEPNSLATVGDSHLKEFKMGNNKDPEKTRPGEMPPGKFHYNPGNMSGKTIGNAERHEDDVAVPVDKEGTRPQPKTIE